jgi:hypothetical protein
MANNSHNWNGTVDTTWYANNPNASAFQISTEEQLRGFADLVNTGVDFNGKTINLVNDIALKGTWTPIGTDENNNFQGTFDGNGKVISGLYINTTANHQGLFGYVKNGTIENLGINVSFIKGGDCVGGLAGYNNGTISNSNHTGNFTT